MPYKVKGKCVYKKDTGKKVGCTKGSVKKYLTALRMNVSESNNREIRPNTGDYLYCTKDMVRAGGPLKGQKAFTKGNFYEIVYSDNIEGNINIVTDNLDRDVNIYTHNIPEHFKLIPRQDYLDTKGFEFFDDIIESEEEFDWVPEFNPKDNVTFLPPVGTRVEVDTEDVDLGTTVTITGEVLEVYPDNEEPGPYFTIMIDGRWQAKWGWECDAEKQFREPHKAWDSKCWYVFPKNGDKVRILDINKNLNEGRYPGIVKRFKVGDMVIVNGWYGEESPHPYDFVARFDNEIGKVVYVDTAPGLSFNSGGDVIVAFDKWRHPTIEGDIEDGGFSFINECRGNRCMQFSNLMDDDYDFSIKPLPEVDMDNAFESLKESEEDEFEWADEMLNNETLSYELIPGNVFKCNHQDDWILEVMITERNDVGVKYISRTGPNGELKYQNKPGDTTLKFARDLVSEGYWIPVLKSESLFGNYRYDISESEEDDFGWADEALETPGLEFNGREILIDVRGFNIDQKEEIYHILKPFIDFEYGNQFQGDWNPKCIIEKQNLKSICLHCGTEDYDYEPQKGHICCTTNTYEEQPVNIRHNIIPINGKLLLANESLNESEEFDSDDFGWAEDVIKKENDVEDITGNNETIMNLPDGAILKITGEADEFLIEDEKVIVLSNFPSLVREKTTMKLVAFNRVIDTYTSELWTTHCGGLSPSPEIKSACHCEQNDINNHNGDMGNGRCWWVDLGYMNSVLYYPSKNSVNENMEEKTLLTEGRYDAITRKVVKDIMSVVTQTVGRNDEIHVAELPFDINGEEEYTQEGLEFKVELNVHHQKLFNTREAKDITEAYYVNMAIADDDENVIMVTVVVDPSWEPKVYEKLFYKLQEDVRHEIEHFTQEGPNRIEDRPYYGGNTATLKTVYGHHKNIIEVPALVHGFYRRAKLEKRPLDDIMIEDLDSDIAKGNLSKNQASKLLKMWIDYAKKHLPRAQYSGEY